MKCFGSCPELPGVSEGVRKDYLYPALSVPVGSKSSNANSYTDLIAWQKTLSSPLHASQNSFPKDYALITVFGMFSFKETHTPNLSSPLGATSSSIETLKTKLVSLRK